jgi:hypothetical protein
MAKPDNVCPLRLALGKPQGEGWTDSDVKRYGDRKRQPIRLTVELLHVLASADSRELSPEVRAEVRKALALVLAACASVMTVLEKIPAPMRANLLSITSGKAGRKASEGYED